MSGGRLFQREVLEKSARAVQRRWHLFDATDQVVTRYPYISHFLPVFFFFFFFFPVVFSATFAENRSRNVETCRSQRSSICRSDLHDPIRFEYMQVVGRMATQISPLLQGKSKPNFSNAVDDGKFSTTPMMPEEIRSLYARALIAHDNFDMNILPVGCWMILEVRIFTCITESLTRIFTGDTVVVINAEKINFTGNF